MNELFVYTINIATYAHDLDRCKQDLSPAELEHANRFVHKKDAQSYMVSHALLRRILARELASEPLDLVFERNAHGKPFLPDSGIHFNLSHSGDYALIAMSRDAPVGIDIEKHQQKRDVLAIAQRYFTPDECLYIKNHAEQEQLVAFYDIWSAKEAYVKALGEGIVYGFDRFSVISSRGDFINKIGGWSLAAMMIDGGYSAAVVGCFNQIIKNVVENSLPIDFYR